MKYVIAFLFTISFAHAEEVKENAKREPARATACPNLERLQQEFTGLSLSSSSDRQRGQTDVSLVLGCLQSFTDLPVSVNVATFEGAVVLAGSAVPFDLGNEVGQSLTDLIATPKYEEAFHRALPKIEECRRNVLYNAAYGEICEQHPRNRYCAKNVRPVVSKKCNDMLYPAPSAQ